MMGKRNETKIKLIKDKSSRNVTFCKRRKGLIKKAMELSILCHKQIGLFIYDEKSRKMISYNSTL